MNDHRWQAFIEKELIEKEEKLKKTWIRPGTEKSAAIEALLNRSLAHEYSLMHLLKWPEMNYEKLMNIEGGPERKSTSRFPS